MPAWSLGIAGEDKKGKVCSDSFVGVRENEFLYGSGKQQLFLIISDNHSPFALSCPFAFLCLLHQASSPKEFWLQRFK
jgi:hypothetical protein